jgi:hypothetical protein
MGIRSPKEVREGSRGYLRGRRQARSPLPDDDAGFPTWARTSFVAGAVRRPLAFRTNWIPDCSRPSTTCPSGAEKRTQGFAPRLFLAVLFGVSGGVESKDTISRPTSKQARGNEAFAGVLTGLFSSCCFATTKLCRKGCTRRRIEDTCGNVGVALCAPLRPIWGRVS